MSIAADLQNAENEYNGFIRWGRVVKLLAEQYNLTEKEVARWLILKDAHLYFTSYELEPHIPRAKQCTDETQAKRVIESFILQENSFAATLRMVTGQSSASNLNVGVHLNQLNQFLQSNSVEELVIQTRTTKNLTAPIELTRPQQREVELLKYLNGDNGYTNIKELPISAKAQAKKDLIQSQPKIFTATTFDKTWAALSARNEISIAEKGKYST